MKNFFIFFLAVLFCCLPSTFISCTEEPTIPKEELSIQEKLIGEWKAESGYGSWDLKEIKLYEDGTCSVEGEMGTWKVVGDELMILGSYGGRFWSSDSIVGKFSCDGQTLNFYGAHIDGKNNSVDLVYKKVA